MVDFINMRCDSVSWFPLMDDGKCDNFYKSPGILPEKNDEFRYIFLSFSSSLMCVWQIYSEIAQYNYTNKCWAGKIEDKHANGPSKKAGTRAWEPKLAGYRLTDSFSFGVLSTDDVSGIHWWRLKSRLPSSSSRKIKSCFWKINRRLA